MTGAPTQPPSRTPLNEKYLGAPGAAMPLLRTMPALHVFWMQLIFREESEAPCITKTIFMLLLKQQLNRLYRSRFHNYISVRYPCVNNL